MTLDSRQSSNFTLPTESVIPWCVFTYGPARIQKSPYAVWPRSAFACKLAAPSFPLWSKVTCH